MANQFSPPLGTSIIGPQYCAPGPNPVDLIITRERGRADNFTVTDSNGNVVFGVKSNIISGDAWQAFRGQSEESSDMIFRSHISSLFQLRIKLDVFLANNVTDVCDFKVIPTWFGHSWDVYIGDSNILVAQINKKLGTIFSIEKYMMSVFPQIDHAFIVALTLTLEF